MERWNWRINIEDQILSFLGLKAQFQEWTVIERFSVKRTVVLAEDVSYEQLSFNWP